MSDRYFEILRESGHKGNYIPSGRQLPRTPPLMDVKRHLDFCNDDPSEDCEAPQQNMEAGTREQDDQNRTFDVSTPETKTEPHGPNSMLKGMKGYQLTRSDLEFIEKMKEEKLIKKLQGDLEVMQRLLKKEMMAAELACASREKAQAELKTFPSCEDLTDWVKVALKVTSPSAEIADLDVKSLLAMVTEQDIGRATEEMDIKLTRLENMMTNEREKAAKERGQLEKQIASEQLKLQGLMSQLSDLTSELAREEEAYKALEKQINTQEAPETKVEAAEEADTSEEQQAAKSQVKRRGKERKKAVKSTEKLQDTTNQSKSTKSKNADGKSDNQTSGKDDHKNTNESLKTQQKSGAAAEKLTKSVKAARGPQKKVEETESNSQESVQAVRGRRKPPGSAQAAASQPKNQSKAKTREAQSASQQAAPSRGRQKPAVAAGEAGEEAQNGGLRRSKRIASRR